MEEIELSFMPRGRNTLALLQAQVDEFEKQAHVHVKLRSVEWSRPDLTRFAINQRGPDVSEIGTTWIDDYIAMNALRPFTRTEMAMIGKSEDFLPSSWQAGHLPGDPQVWAIPWLAEPYIIHYRKDLLRQAGIVSRLLSRLIRSWHARLIFSNRAVCGCHLGRQCGRRILRITHFALSMRCAHGSGAVGQISVPRMGSKSGSTSLKPWQPCTIIFGYSVP